MLLLGSDFTLRPSWLQAYVSATTWQCTRFPSFCPLRWSSQTSSMARPQGFQPMVSGGDKANVVLDSLAPPTSLVLSFCLHARKDMYCVLG